MEADAVWCLDGGKAYGYYVLIQSAEVMDGEVVPNGGREEVKESREGVSFCLFLCGLWVCF